jgi:hypothetical protein
LQETGNCYFWVRAPHDRAIGNRKLNCLTAEFGIYCATTVALVAVRLAGGSDSSSVIVGQQGCYSGGR